MIIGFVRSIASWLLDTFVGDSTFTTMLRASRYKSVQEYVASSEQKNKYEKLFYEEVRLLLLWHLQWTNMAQVWDKQAFDGIIAPVQAVPAIPHG